MILHVLFVLPFLELYCWRWQDYATSLGFIFFEQYSRHCFVDFWIICYAQLIWFNFWTSTMSLMSFIRIDWFLEKTLLTLFLTLVFNGTTSAISVLIITFTCGVIKLFVLWLDKHFLVFWIILISTCCILLHIRATFQKGCHCLDMLFTNDWWAWNFLGCDLTYRAFMQHRLAFCNV